MGVRSLMVQRREHGFSIVEVLLGVTIFGFLASAVIGAVIYGRVSTAGAGDRTRANLLAEEGLEAVRNIGAASFSNLTDGTYGLSKSSNVWALTGTSDTSDIYTRQVTISSIDSNRKKVTSTISWTGVGGNDQVSVVGELSNWRAVSKSWANAINPGSLTVGAIAGIKIDAVGNYAYLVSNSTTNNFSIIDISNGAAPTLVKTISTSATPTNIAVSGNYAYITSSTATSCLKIYDISNPASPTLVKTLAATGTASCNGVFVNGNYAYVTRTLSMTTGSNEFNVVNVTTPASASIVGSYNNDLYTMNEVWASGNYAYVALTSSLLTGEMVVMNVATPTAPTQAGSYDASGTNTAPTITGSGNTVYLGYGSILNSINVTTPTAPTSLGTFTAASTIRDIDIDPISQLLFMGTASTTGEFQVVNVATPSSMSLVKTLDLSGTSALAGVSYDSTLDSVAGASSATTAQLRELTKN
jgi:Tfp pilus assembly protein PilV